jgi:hypothetical protein
MRPCSDRVLVSGINFLVDFEDDLATAPTTGTQKDREIVQAQGITFLISYRYLCLVQVLWYCTYHLGTCVPPLCSKKVPVVFSSPLLSTCQGTPKLQFLQSPTRLTFLTTNPPSNTCPSTAISHFNTCTLFTVVHTCTNDNVCIIFRFLR